MRQHSGQQRLVVVVAAGYAASASVLAVGGSALAFVVFAAAAVHVPTIENGRRVNSRTNSVVCSMNITFHIIHFNRRGLGQNLVQNMR